MEPYIEKYKIAGFQTDHNGKLSIRNLCNFLFEAAGNHCIGYNIAVSDLHQLGLTWMLSRIHIEIEHLPDYGETINVKTWPTGARGLFSCRDFMVTTESGEELVKATSGWLIINLEKRRVNRLPESVLAIHPSPEQANRIIIDDFKDKLSEPSEGSITNGFRASRSTLDLNKHVTASVYVDWMFDALSEDLVRNNRLASLELNYKHEILPGGTALVKHNIKEDNERSIISHSVNDKENGMVNCLARSEWIPY